MNGERNEITGPVRTRFAPSPTGFLHVGGVRTAMFSWLLAQRFGGEFLLRVEDTDQKRFVEGAEQNMMESLRWVGIAWAEGPDVGGPHAPYRQSERLPIYQLYAEQLVAQGDAYQSWTSPAELTVEREAAAAAHQPPPRRDRWRNATPEQVAAQEATGQRFVIRLKLPEEGSVVFYDLVKKDTITFDYSGQDDIVILKSDGFPTYHLAATVDDHLMGITHVMRAEEWLASTPKHLFIYQSLGWQPPAFAHVPNILRPDGRGKMSKRDGDASTEQFWTKGYLPEAMFNYLALQGWSYDDHTEIMTVAEISQRFSLDRVQPSPARWNLEKLNWMNSQYINHVLTLDDLARRSLPFMQSGGYLKDVVEGDEEYLYYRAALELIKDRLKLLGEAPDLLSYFFADRLQYDTTLLLGKGITAEQVAAVLDHTIHLLQSDQYAAWHLSDKEMGPEANLRGLAAELGVKVGSVFMPIRVAITGRSQSPGLFETAEVLGKERTLFRLREALHQVQGQ